MAEVDYQAAIELQKYYQTNPLAFNSQVLGGDIWEKQKEVWEAIANHRRVAVKSGNGNGKSHVIAKIILWWLYSYYPSKVITTAPTFLQVEKIIWSELATLYEKSKIPIGGNLTKTELRFDKEWYALGVSTDDENRFQGFHSENLLVIFDEAGGVDTKIWNATRGLATATNNRVLVVGNPLSPTGDFYNCFTDGSKWHQVTISCLDNPNYKAKKDVFPGISGYEWVEEMRNELGEENPMWYSKILGQFPIEATDTLIPLSWIENARNKEIEMYKQVSIGVDVARYGDNESVITVFNGFKVDRMEVFKKRNTTELAGLIINVLRDMADKSNEYFDFNAYTIPIAIDDTGLGGGVSDILSEQGYNVIPVILRSRADLDEKFFDLRSEIFWNLRERFRTGIIQIPKDDMKLSGQLVSLKYEMDKKGRIKVTPKERLHAQGLGSTSPDRADSLSLAVYASTGGSRRCHRIKDTSNMISSGAGGW